VTENISPGLPVIEMNTDFRVLTALKGKPSADTVSLVHFRLDET
jgi:hypothetical protein